MRLLLRSDTGEISLTKDLTDEDRIPPYAILSHRWLADTEEPTFEDLSNGTGKNKPGYEKIQFCGEQARQDGLQYFWVDTCCINRANYAELSQAINSMFRWYRNSTRCYIYLSDVPSPPFGTTDDFNSQSWDSDFWKSKWFTRGWTLQELLAPRSAEFFSREHKRLGDKCSLKQQICKITSIPESVLQGAPLSQFRVDELIWWMERRQTKLEEDKVYSLLGIFDVKLPLFYGEGAANALKRLREAIDKREKCIQDLRLTDPHYDKKRIEDTNGGLLEDSYRWILKNSEYQKWYSTQQSPLLWIRGNPGKGKTMLLCGIINELNKSIVETALLSYFFCQATDSRINNATAVLRGLIFMLVGQQSSLVTHIQKRYDHAGKAIFEDVNSWVALSEIFTDILQDPGLRKIYLVIDALDECQTGLEQLLDLIVQSPSPHVKWILSSRNWPPIAERLDVATGQLSLELNAKSVSAAVDVYIQHKVSQLAKQKKYSATIQEAVLHYLSSNANGTFLWVALVCQNLRQVSLLSTLATLTAFPPGLDCLYGRMMAQINKLNDAQLCKRIIALAAVAYRPMLLVELALLLDIPENLSNDLDALREIVGLCGSFLTVQDDTVYFVHQSATDFLVKKASDHIFVSGPEEVHHTIFSKSLQVMDKTLQRDVYDLRHPGFPINQVKLPRPDPLAAAKYSCIYWVEHLIKSLKSIKHEDIQDHGKVEVFLRNKYLYWLEALSLLGKVSDGVFSMANLRSLLQVGLS
jgi:hypothetical protein